MIMYNRICLNLWAPYSPWSLSVRENFVLQCVQTCVLTSFLTDQNIPFKHRCIFASLFNSTKSTAFKKN